MDAHDGHRLPLLPRTDRPRRGSCATSSTPSGRASPRRCARTTSRLVGAPGRVRVRLVLPRRRARDDRAAVRRRQRPGAALPPRDRGPGDRDPGEHVPRAVLGGARLGRGEQRAGHRRRVAAQGGPRRAAARVRRRHPPAARRRGGQPRRPRHGEPRPAVDPARHRPAAHRPGRHRRDGRTARRLGRRPRHREPAARHPPPGPRRLPRRRRPGRGPPPGPPQLGARPRTRRWRSRTTSGAATSTGRRSRGTPRPSRPSTRWPPRSPPSRWREVVNVSADPARHVAWIHEYVEQGWDEVYLHFVGQEQEAVHRHLRRARPAPARPDAAAPPSRPEGRRARGGDR